MSNDPLHELFGEQFSRLLQFHPPSLRTAFGLVGLDLTGDNSYQGAYGESGESRRTDTIEGAGTSPQILRGRYYLFLQPEKSGETDEPGGSAEGNTHTENAPSGNIRTYSGVFSLNGGRGELENYDFQTVISRRAAGLLLALSLPELFPLPPQSGSRVVDLGGVNDGEAPGNISWDYSRLFLPGSIPRLVIDDLDAELCQRVLDEDLYNFWSRDWSVDFYIRQAALGFIATSYELNDEVILTPELQESYAILDWDKRVVDRGVKKILESQHGVAEGILLEVSADPMKAVAELRKAWGDQTWLTVPYVRLVSEIADRCATTASKGGEASADFPDEPSFRIWGVVLYARDCGGGGELLPAAGELGYTIGRTYTSLSGFFHRGRKCWNHFGKLQLHLLARHLEQRGIEFWNLGHPYMDYKTRMGATITPRRDFLGRWGEASKGAAVDISRDAAQPAP